MSTENRRPVSGSGPSGCLITLVTLATILIGLGAGCATLVSHMNFDLNLGSPPRKHLKPIPVSKSVCPYVQLMHVAANGFQVLSPVQDLAPYVDDQPAHWPKLRADVAHRLDVLDHAVLIGELAPFPKPIHRRLVTVVADVRAGEVQLVRAHDSFDLVLQSQGVLSDGQIAFGEASDLVGNACGVHLAADAQPAAGS